MQDLDVIVELSREFGGPDYVRGGGGNTSVKDPRTLWVKPSGTTMAGLTADMFVAMDRAKINALYSTATPTEPAAREELVKNLMAAAVLNAAGRPSVEAPLHNVFEARFVVHTHPALVNGLTCGQGGEAACGRLFPDALWVEYIDPGYTLCMEARRRIQRYTQTHGRQPSLVVLQNHGLFVAADTADEIRALYAGVLDTLNARYAEAGVGAMQAIPSAIAAPKTEALVQKLFGGDAAHIASSGLFTVVEGPLTPDHLVYAKAFPYAAALTPAAAARYRAERGYAPKVVVAGDHVFGIGTTEKNAALALEFAFDGTQVMALAEAFGGIHYMSDAHREFIESWEVESYRARQI